MNKILTVIAAISLLGCNPENNVENNNFDPEPFQDITIESLLHLLTMDELRDKNEIVFTSNSNDSIIINFELWEETARKRAQDTFYFADEYNICLLYTSPSPRDATLSRMPSSA